MILAFGVASFWQWRLLKIQQDQTVETIANLVDVPQKVEAARDPRTLKTLVLDSIYQANKSTLVRAPDTPSMKLWPSVG